MSSVAQAEPTELDRARARALMDDGDRRVEQNDPEGGLRAYREAHAIMGVPTTGIEVARTLAALGRLLEAREMALAVASIPARPAEPRVFGQARASAEQLAQSLERRIPTLSVLVSGVDVTSQARVSIDGSVLAADAASSPRPLDPGQHTVVVSGTGYAEQTLKVSLSEGERETLEVTLVPLPRRAANRSALAAPVLRPVVEQDDDTSPLVYVGFGAGAAGVLIGGVAGALSLSRASSARELCNGDVCPPAARDDIEASETLATISNVGFGVALVGVGVGVYGLLSSGEKEKPLPALRVRPKVGLGAAGIEGRF